MLEEGELVSARREGKFTYFRANSILWERYQPLDPKPVLPLLPAASALTAVLLMFAICNVNLLLIVGHWDVVPSS